MARRIAWTEQGKADLRAINQRRAMNILHGLARFLSTAEGDVKQLHGFDPPELRLRIGDYRIRFHDHGDWIEILRVRNRKDAYR